MAKTSYAIALGSNRRSRHGAPARNVQRAIEALAALGTVEHVSGILNTPAMGPAGRAFANAVAILRAECGPDALLGELKKIERDFGRRPARRWGPRVLDLDIILWSEGAWGGQGPIIPHPQFRKRRFVLAPLAQIAPRWRDPLSGASVRQLLCRLDKGASVDRAQPRS